MAGQSSHCETNPRLLRWCVLGLAWVILSACSEHSADKDVTPLGTPESERLTEPLHTYSENTAEHSAAASTIIASYQHAYAKAASDTADLRSRIDDFYAEPNQDRLNTLRQQLHEAHQSFHIAETSLVFDLNHPVLDSASIAEPIHHPIRIRLDQYPLIAGYLDTVEGYPASGIVHSEIDITLENLNDEHQFSDTAYVALGFHALGFLLHGSDPEQRLAQLHTTNPDELQTAKRRETYIKILGEQILNDVSLIEAAWQEPDGYYAQYLRQCSTSCIAALLARMKAPDESPDPSAGHLAEDTLSKQSAFRKTLLGKLEGSAPPAEP